MSLVFKNEPRRRAVVLMAPTAEQVEQAMEAVAGGSGPFDLTQFSMSVEVGCRLISEMRRAEAALFAGIADGSVTTKAHATACVQQATDGPFPAAAFVNRIVANCGGTWAAALQAAKDEIGE